MPSIEKSCHSTAALRTQPGSAAVPNPDDNCPLPEQTRSRDLKVSMAEYIAPAIA